MAAVFAFAFMTLAGCTHGGSATTRPAASEAQVRYFFVVPQWLPDGTMTTAQRKSLEVWLVQRASGYTRIGPCRGGWHDGRDLIEEDNLAYFLVGPDGLEPEIRRRIVDQFEQRRAFVVKW